VPRHSPRTALRGCQPEDEAVRSASVTGTLAGSAAVPDAFMASRRDGAPVVRPGAVLGSVSSAWTAGPAAVAATGGQRDRLARYPGHRHGETPPAPARDQPGPARRPGYRHDRRRGTPHHPGRRPRRAGTAGALAAHPAMSRPGSGGGWRWDARSGPGRRPEGHRSARACPSSVPARTSAWRRPGGDHAGGAGPAGGMLVTRSCHGFRRS
jgi:hypothetical protein